jgi:hypothetical protein
VMRAMVEKLCAPFVLRSEPRGGAGRKQAILYRQNEMPETQCSLFPIDCKIPKLDVAGSNPVSRSIFSITYRHISDRNLQENGVTSFLCRLELIAFSGLVTK